ncbi:arginine--tRNA ligase [Streptomyces sp. NPDC059506]|uniref:arginine--tRNA ligase n=1 Tax=Streptomyces TaxID=1883 RepID=UPI000CA9D9F2|nr:MULTISPECIES: arginine--tRNA ligase [unclassified Streptomyces]MCZ2524230.1 arginine--tRNA ligase [Streptomyces sp. HB2AG]PLW74019.1 arginine--tRNA ligase [Streptomyces sp. DJ]QMV21745.1 arginine--tRNA ligase [Streptomyces sp. SCUT-3]
MTPAELSTAVLSSVRSAVEAGELSVPVPGQATVERPKNRDHGDWATNVALQLAKPAGMPPRKVAEIIAARLSEVPGVASVDIAGPGFLNITLDAASQGALARTIVEAGREYGKNDAFAGLKINLEFVSANPTGPIHIGGVRWAAVGDSLGRILRAAGADVTTEYYINDAGVQISKFGASLLAQAHGRPVPEDGYVGEYVADIARQIVEAKPGVLDLPEDEQLEVFRAEGLALMVAEIQRSMEEFGVHFDVWFSEKSLHDSGAVEKAMDRLREQGHVFEQDGATWLRTTDFGDDKDRVLVKADGETTYFASDAAYYLNKRDRGNEVCVYMLGADHHGYVGRLKAIAACAGDDADRNIEVLIGQFVKMLKDGQEVRMSKRAGNIITIDDVVDWIGVDAARYALARSNTDSTLTLDIDVLTSTSNDNPVYYVQYAHSRMSSVNRNAAEMGVDKGSAEDFKPELLVHEREGELLGALAEFPAVVASAAELREPHRVARYLERLAGTYHRFYGDCRILPRGDEETNDLHRARLWLAEATRTVIANGLDLLGVSAPERM